MPTYVSTHGHDELKRELVHRKRELRREIASKIEAAKELGDLSENFEYHEAKEQQAQNESRIWQLEDMLKDIVTVETRSGGVAIALGSRFTARNHAQQKKTFEIVGSQEANPMEGKISNESPLGQAFLGCGVDEIVELPVPSGTITYTITEIL
jgi:transcription elongation factor GreA